MKLGSGFLVSGPDFEKSAYQRWLYSKNYNLSLKLYCRSVSFVLQIRFLSVAHRVMFAC